jgi:hypothetical protein
MFVGSFVVIIALLGCKAERINRQSRPTGETEEIDGYLDSSESDVLIDEETEVSISKTKLSIGRNSANTDFKVRLSRRSSVPELNEVEASLLGDAQGDIVDIEMFDPKTNNVLSSDDLLIPYKFEQQISQPESALTHLGLMVITDPKGPEPKRLLLPQTELNIGEGNNLALSQSATTVVHLNLKLTSATIWPVIYAQDALKYLETTTAAKLSNSGGNEATTTVVKSSVFPDLSLKINSGANYTNSADVSLQLSASGAAEMYVTNQPGCTSGGQWEPYAESWTWTLASQNTLTRVYAKFRSTDGSSSNCMNDSITHDSLSPDAPSSFSTQTATSSLSASPTLQWNAGSDSGSGISHYEIAIGSSAGATDIKSWHDVGTGLTKSISGLSLTHQGTYYPSIRSVDLAGNLSSPRLGSSWVASNQGVDLQSGLVLHLDAENPYGQGAGSVNCSNEEPWVDLTGTIPHVTMQNFASYCDFNNISGWSSVWPDYRMNFDGSNDYIDAGTNSTYNFDRDDSFSIATRIKVGPTLSGASKAIISKLRSGAQSSGSFFGYEIFLQTTGTIDLLIDRSFTSYSYIRSSTLVSINQIYDIVAVYDQTNMKLYINGSLEGEETFTDTSTGPPLGPLMLGCRNVNIPEHLFNGSIYNVRIYNRALNDLEVAALSD